MKKLLQKLGIWKKDEETRSTQPSEMDHDVSTYNEMIYELMRFADENGFNGLHLARIPQQDYLRLLDAAKRKVIHKYADLWNLNAYLAEQRGVK